MKKVFGMLFVLLLSFAASAALQLVEDFEAMVPTGTATPPVGFPDGATCTGTMGGFWDTESEATGNAALESKSGSKTVRFMTGSGTGAVNGRGVAFAGLTDTIDTNEEGTMFFRFVIRNDTQTVRSYLGLHALTGTNPLGSTANNTPWNYIAAGFAALGSGTGGTTYDIKTTDGATTLAAGLLREQWYNVWLVANHVTDTFDLYLSTATGPGIGAPAAPQMADIIADDLAFGAPITNPLTGGMFVAPAVTVGGQSSRTYVDDIYWQSIPEPATMLLLGIGSLFVTRRK